MQFRYTYTTLFDDSPKDPICVVVCTYMSWLYERGNLSRLRLPRPTRLLVGQVVHTLYLN